MQLVNSHFVLKEKRFYFQIKKINSCLQSISPSMLCIIRSIKKLFEQNIVHLKKVSLIRILYKFFDFRTTPDFRYSLGLSPDERAFRKKRIPIVCETMKAIFGEDKGPRSPEEVKSEIRFSLDIP